MARLAAGQDSALNDLMTRHAGAVFQFLNRMLANEEDANELAQETFVRVYKNCRSYRPEAKFTTWLLTIAANLARNQLRWRQRHPNVSLDAPHGEDGATLSDQLPATTSLPGEQLSHDERMATIRGAVQRLPEDLREAIVLCELEDQSVADAAAILETTPKAIESRLYRGRQILRERLARWLN